MCQPFVFEFYLNASASNVIKDFANIQYKQRTEAIIEKIYSITANNSTVQK